MNPAWSLCRFSPVCTTRSLIVFHVAFSDVTSSVSSAGTGTSYFFRSSYTCSIGTMMASISASFSLMSCWIAITDRTSSRSSTGLLSHFVVSLTYVTSSSSFSLPCA